MAIDGVGGRVLLLAWAADDTPRLCNLVGTDAQGAVVWRAALPGLAERDCFTGVEREGVWLRARTFSGLDVLIDPSSGLPVLDQPLAA